MELDILKDVKGDITIELIEKLEHKINILISTKEKELIMEVPPLYLYFY